MKFQLKESNRAKDSEMSLMMEKLSAQDSESLSRVSILEEKLRLLQSTGELWTFASNYFRATVECGIY